MNGPKWLATVERDLRLGRRSVVSSSGQGETTPSVSAPWHVDGDTLHGSLGFMFVYSCCDSVCLVNQCHYVTTASAPASERHWRAVCRSIVAGIARPRAFTIHRVQCATRSPGNGPPSAFLSPSHREGWRRKCVGVRCWVTSQPRLTVPDLSAGESEDEFMKRELAELTARRAEADVGCHAAQQ